MTYREEIVKGLLEYQRAGWTGINDYYRPYVAGALFLLKTQEPRLLTEADFQNNPNADGGGAIPCWKEPKSPTRREGWAVIVYGKWLADTSAGIARYWAGKPSEKQKGAEPWA